MAGIKTRELRGDHPFPHDVTAYDAGNQVGDSGYRFGINKERTVAIIRELADRLESGEMLLQSLESRHKLMNDDYTMTEWIIDVAQKK